MEALLDMSPHTEAESVGNVNAMRCDLKCEARLQNYSLAASMSRQGSGVLWEIAFVLVIQLR